MAFLHGKLAVFKVNDAGSSLRDLSAFLPKSGVKRSVAALDVTTFGKSAKVVIPGLADGTVSIDGLYDPTAVTGPDAILSGLLGLMTTYQYYPSGTAAGNVEYSGACCLTSYELSDDVSSPVSFTAEFQLSDAVTRTAL